MSTDRGPKIPVTIGESDDKETSLVGKIKHAWKILDAEVTGELKNSEGKTTSVTINYRVTTGGLSVKQLT